MEKPANQLIEGTQVAQDKVLHLRDKLEYFNVKGDFFEKQTLIFNEIINKVELKGIEISKEEQELNDKLTERAEVKKNLVNILKGLKSQQKVENHKKNDETLVRINGFYHCFECHFKTKWTRKNLKVHINAIHRKLKPWKCSDCTKDFSTKNHLAEHRLSMHNVNKGWICDCCGFQFGHKNLLKLHMMIHLPPSFSCSDCGKKFVRAGNLKIHKKRHQGILNEVCKLCNKGYATKGGLSDHIKTNHFTKFNCEVKGCSSIKTSKSQYKSHLKTVHKKDDQVLIGNLIKNLEKLKPNFLQLKYV